MDPFVAPVEAALTRIFRVMRREMRTEAGKHNLTPIQLSALRFLADGEERRMSEIAAFLGVSNGAATGICERIAAMALIARRADPHDRRSTLVSITPDGRALMQVILDVTLRFLDGAMAHLSPHERHMITGGVLALAAAVDPPQDA